MYSTGTPFAFTAATIWSASGLGTRGSFAPGDHKQWRFDLVHVVDGRDRFHELGIFIWVAVLCGAVLATPRAGVLEESGPVGDADDVDAGRPQIRIHRHLRQRHEPAIAAAHDHDLLGVDVAGILQILVSEGHVFDRVHALLVIVGMGIFASVAGAAADVGARAPHIPRLTKYWITELKSARSCPSGPPCTYTMAVEFAVLLCVFGEVEECGDLFAIECGIGDGLGLNESIGRDAGAGGVRDLRSAVRLSGPESRHRS